MSEIIYIPLFILVFSFMLVIAGSILSTIFRFCRTERYFETIDLSSSVSFTISPNFLFPAEIALSIAK